MTDKKQAAPAPKKRKKKYLNNADMLIELEKSRENGKMTERLGHMLQTLATRYASQGNFAGYSYVDDMIAYAMYMICRTWHRFDPTKSNNPFAFFTQCIKHSYYQFLNKEKRQRVIRDELLVFSGMNPSNTYLSDYEDEMKEQREMGDLDCMEDKQATDTVDVEETQPTS